MGLLILLIVLIGYGLIGLAEAFSEQSCVVFYFTRKSGRLMQ